MSTKCGKEQCSLCQRKFLGRRHCHPEGWSSALRSFLEQESSLTVGNGDLCVCGACYVGLKRALTAKDKGDSYQLRWISTKRSCCVPSCTSAIRVDKHKFSWDVICSAIGIASISPPVDTSLCSGHYTLVYKMQHITVEACVCCGIKRKHEHSNTAVNFRTCPNPSLIESYLWDTVDFDGTIQEGDQVCYPYRNCHNVSSFTQVSSTP